MGGKFHTLLDAVSHAMAHTPRSSSLVENLNSRLRTCFTLRRHLGGSYLDPLDRFSPGELDPGRLAASRTGRFSNRNPTLTGQRFLRALCNPKRADSEPRPALQRAAVSAGPGVAGSRWPRHR